MQSAARRAFTALSLAAIFCTLLGVLAAPASAWTDSENRISYTAPVNGIGQVFTMRPDGSDPRQITHDGVKKCDPAFSPDGSEIAYSSSNGHYYVVPAAGGTPVDIFPEGVDAEGTRRPTWSPDGNTIVFHVTKGYQGGAAPAESVIVDLYMVRRAAKGEPWSAAEPVTSLPKGKALHPRFSPDGKSLLYSFSPTGLGSDYDLWIMPAPVADAAPATRAPGVQITTNTGGLMSSWAPSGRQVAFVSCGTLYTLPVTVTSTGATAGTPKRVANAGCAATWSSRSETQIAYEYGGKIYRLDLAAKGKATALRAGSQPGW